MDNNSALYGGSIAVTNPINTCSITNLYILNSIAYNTGGGIYIATSGEIPY